MYKIPLKISFAYPYVFMFTSFDWIYVSLHIFVLKSLHMYEIIK